MNKPKEKLFQLLDKLVPLVNSVSNSIRFMFFLGLTTLIWLFVWLYFLQHSSLTFSLIIAGLISLPLIILLRFWLALIDLKELSNLTEKIVADVAVEAKSAWQTRNIKQKKATGFIGKAKNLFEMHSLLSELDEVFSQYLNLGLLLNPFSLMLAGISLIIIFFLSFIAIILLLTTIL